MQMAARPRNMVVQDHLDPRIFVLLIILLLALPDNAIHRPFLFAPLPPTEVILRTATPILSNLSPNVYRNRYEWRGPFRHGAWLALKRVQRPTIAVLLQLANVCKQVY
ncbi:hypothetical protein P154DRAFT_517804 [Amniculicola lignicola CBS 123094]|uniref:Uncharacterized protein n=1 Tax=Amniculicola lignicola CBS 123094 TaxID=1392246 RepID=A0A6A5WY81_9PLEO|nr:hypothetical protein P154DRAFT_517804 [Amniculicola lignicola CBS 123094]